MGLNGIDEVNDRASEGPAAGMFAAESLAKMVWKGQGLRLVLMS